MNRTEILIRPFQAEDALAFRQLNEEWISLHFGIEEHDRVQLGDPEGHILRPGGQIFMAVAAPYRGRGLGRKLLLHSIAQAKALGAKTLYLGSNGKLAEAVHLYESAGFRHLPPEKIPPSAYARSTIFMELDLSVSSSPESDRLASLQPA
jgi:putative acetyltransferase